MIAKVFGEVLRELRTDKNLSQEKLAEYCNLDRTYISLLERGLRQPTLTTIIDISEALNIDASNIVKEVQKRIKVK